MCRRYLDAAGAICWARGATTCERDYNNEEIEFMKAMDQYKRENRRPFPTWSEVLEVLRAMGYRKVAEPSQMPGLSTTLPPTVDS